MRKIEAIIRPEKVSDVKEALERLGCPGITVQDVVEPLLVLGSDEGHVH